MIDSENFGFDCNMGRNVHTLENAVKALNIFIYNEFFIKSSEKRF